MDGVITDTADLHARAWKELFDGVLVRAATPARPLSPFDLDTDYRRFVDGRSRAEGIGGFLASRGVVLPARGAGVDTLEGAAENKNALFLAAVAEQGVTALPGAVHLVRRLRAAGVRTGLVTASCNAEALLREVGLRGVFDVVVDGGVATDVGLASKPDPAVFLEAARRLRVVPALTAVLEDALAGVAAGAAGGFGLVIGVDSSGRRASDLLQAGADFVLRDLDDPRLRGLLRP
jgi:HAD superfamily hydrolase (TIGR01509 family)